MKTTEKIEIHKSGCVDEIIRVGIKDEFYDFPTAHVEFYNIDDSLQINAKYAHKDETLQKMIIELLYLIEKRYNGDIEISGTGGWKTRTLAKEYGGTDNIPQSRFEGWIRDKEEIAEIKYRLKRYFRKGGRYHIENIVTDYKAFFVESTKWRDLSKTSHWRWITINDEFIQNFFTQYVEKHNN